MSSWTMELGWVQSQDDANMVSLRSWELGYRETMPIVTENIYFFMTVWYQILLVASSSVLGNSFILGLKQTISRF